MLRPPLDKIWIFIIFFRQENRPFLMATMAAFFFVAVVVLDETFDCVICSYANELRTMESLFGSRKAPCLPDGMGDRTETFPEGSYRCCDPP